MKPATTSLKGGLTRKEPKGEDSSMKLGKGSVNDGATRSGVAPTPKSLGPRTA